MATMLSSNGITGYPEYQPPMLKLMNLETVIEDATESEENGSGAEESEDVDRPSRPLNEHDTLDSEVRLRS